MDGNTRIAIWLNAITFQKAFAASQFAYLYYALKVCTLFVKKKYILLSM